MLPVRENGYIRAGVSNSRASGGHIASWQLCRRSHNVFNLEITTSLGNGLGNVAAARPVITSPAFLHDRPSSEIEFCGTKWI